MLYMTQNGRMKHCKACGHGMRANKDESGGENCTRVPCLKARGVPVPGKRPKAITLTFRGADARKAFEAVTGKPLHTPVVPGDFSDFVGHNA